ncbi:MAG TPA: Rieske (2Fe-2S) protein, partial [Acidimicrobiales bacterium]|nr:Rieske (2Fe-2S) protein [Acidimicrobiales bacterium]
LEGVLYAFDDTCPHAACSLSQGELEDGTVICPCHFGTFDLASGAVLDGPPPAPITLYAAREVDGTLEIQAS